jgi:hypothetical protein
MTAPCFHAESSARVFGGKPEDYLDIHSWFDASKAAYPDIRHRALRHHAFGIAECVEKFGEFLYNSAGTKVAIRYIGEQHIIEDCGGRIPTAEDWLKTIAPETWMAKATPTFLKHGNREIR